jgi:hypothetical protein
LASANLVLGVSFIWSVGPAFAQDETEAVSDDSETWFNLAREASSRGDYPAAIAALERILLSNPDLANIKLELGLLYLRVGNAALAKNYLQEAYDSPDAPEAVRSRVQEALGNANLGLDRTRVDGFVQSGMRYQSNPNGSPGEVSIVLPGGVPVIVGSDGLSVTRESDFSFFSSANVTVSHRLGDQRNSSLVGSINVGQQTYLDVEDIDTIYVGGEVGPRFLLGSATAPTGYIRPFVSASYLSLGGADYFAAYGGGATVSVEPKFGLLLGATAAYTRRDYQNSGIRPRATDQTGDYFAGSASLYWQATSGTGVRLALIAERADTNAPYWSRDTIGASFGLDNRIGLFRGSGATLRMGAAYRSNKYDDIDPLVSLTEVRSEDRFELSAGLDIPILQRAALNLRFQQTWNEADLPNYDYNNTLASVGVTHRF